MKPLFTIKLMSQDPMDPASTESLGVIEVDTIGDVTITLTRDEMGMIQLKNSLVEGRPSFIDQLREAELSLKELHEKLAATQIAANIAHTDMFAIHKWLTR